MRDQLKSILEAAIFAANTPLSLSQLQELFDAPVKPDTATLEQALNELALDYASRGVELKEVASGFRFQVRSSFSPWVSKLFEERPARYSRALLETLAIIAYRQPTSRGEIEDIRGVAVSTNIIRTLLDRGWITVMGYKEVPGKPALFGTTKLFLDYFGLKSLSELPPLKSFLDELEAPQLSEIAQPRPELPLTENTVYPT